VRCSHIEVLELKTKYDTFETFVELKILLKNHNSDLGPKASFWKLPIQTEYDYPIKVRTVVRLTCNTLYLSKMCFSSLKKETVMTIWDREGKI